MIRRSLLLLLALCVTPAFANAPSPDANAYRLVIRQADRVITDATLFVADGGEAALSLTSSVPYRQSLTQDDQFQTGLNVTLQRHEDFVRLELSQRDLQGMDTIAPVDDTDGLGMDLPRSERRQMIQKLALAVGQTVSWPLAGSLNDAPRTVSLTRVTPSGAPHLITRPQD